MTQTVTLQIDSRTLTETERRLLAWVQRNAREANGTPWLGMVQWVPLGKGGMLLFYDATPAGRVREP